MNVESGHTISSLRALSYRFSVHTDDPWLRHEIAGLFAALRDDGPAEHRYTLEVMAHASGPGADGGVRVDRDGEQVARCADVSVALSWLVWDVNRAAAESSPEHLLLHAGALQVAHDGAHGAGVLLPGVSGSGKSTLSAWLTGAGMGYLTDELAALELATGRLLPYPKPITVKSAPGSARERHLAVGEGRHGRLGDPCVPGFVVFPRYVPGARTTLRQLSETEAFMELAANAVNFSAHGDDATAALGALAGRCACARLITSDVDEAGRLVLGLVGAELEVGHAS